MAGRFPIYYTEKTLPGQGPNVTGRLNFDTGAAEMAAAIGGMGEAMFQVGGQMWKVQADQQLSEATMNARKEMNSLQVRLDGMDDETQYETEWERTRDVIQNPEIKNGLAARRYQEWLNSAIPDMELYVANKTRQRIKDKSTATMLDVAAEAINTGNVSALDALTQSQVQNGLMTQADRTDLLLKVRHDASMQAAQKYAWFNPEEVLERLRKDGTLKEFPNLTDPDDWGRIRNYAVMRRSDLAQQNEKAKDAEEQILFKMIQDPQVDIQKALDYINGMQYQTAIEKDGWIKRIAATMELLRQGKSNPFKVTQDYPKMIQTMLDIERGQAMTIMDINKKWLSGPNGQALWSLTDNEWLKDTLKARDKPTEGDILNHPLAKDYLQSLRMLYLKDEVFRDDLLEEYHKNRLLLETAIREDFKNPAKLVERYKQITNERKKKNAKGTIGRIWGFVTTTPQEMFEYQTKKWKER